MQIGARQSVGVLRGLVVGSAALTNKRVVQSCSWAKRRRAAAGLLVSYRPLVTIKKTASLAFASHPRRVAVDVLEIAQIAVGSSAID